MSIYGGFATRQDEHTYNKLLLKLIKVLQSHLLEFLTPNNFQHEKMKQYSRIITKMHEYEEHKYLPPKFTEFLQPICSLFIPTFSSQHVIEHASEKRSDSEFMGSTNALTGYKTKSQYQERYNKKTKMFAKEEPQKSRVTESGYKNGKSKHPEISAQKLQKYEIRIKELKGFRESQRLHNEEDRRSSQAALATEETHGEGKEAIGKTIARSRKYTPNTLIRKKMKTQY